MKKSELGKTLAVVYAQWPYMRIDDVFIELWHSQFGEIEIGAFNQAIAAVMKEQSGPPEMANVYKKIQRLTLEDPKLTEGEAWELLKTAVKRFGWSDGEKAMGWLQQRYEAVAEAARQLGWREICEWQTRDEVANRAHFWKMFSALERERDEARTLGLPKPVPMRERLELDHRGPRKAGNVIEILSERGMVPALPKPKEKKHGNGN